MPNDTFEGYRKNLRIILPVFGQMVWQASKRHDCRGSVREWFLKCIASKTQKTKGAIEFAVADSPVMPPAAYRAEVTGDGEMGKRIRTVYLRGMRRQTSLMRHPSCWTTATSNPRHEIQGSAATDIERLASEENEKETGKTE